MRARGLIRRGLSRRGGRPDRPRARGRRPSSRSRSRGSAGGGGREAPAGRSFGACRRSRDGSGRRSTRAGLPQSARARPRSAAMPGRARGDAPLRLPSRVLLREQLDQLAGIERVPVDEVERFSLHRVVAGRGGDCVDHVVDWDDVERGLGAPELRHGAPVALGLGDRAQDEVGAVELLRLPGLRVADDDRRSQDRRRNPRDGLLGTQTSAWNLVDS